MDEVSSAMQTVCVDERARLRLGGGGPVRHAQKRGIGGDQLQHGPRLLRAHAPQLREQHCRAPNSLPTNARPVKKPPSGFTPAQPCPTLLTDCLCPVRVASMALSGDRRASHSLIIASRPQLAIREVQGCQSTQRTSPPCPRRPAGGQACVQADAHAVHGGRQATAWALSACSRATQEESAKGDTDVSP